MLIIMNNGATAAECDRVHSTIEELGFTATEVPGAQRVAICVTGNHDRVAAPRLERLPGVLEVIHVTKPYKLVSREVRPDGTTVMVGDVAISARDTEGIRTAPTLIAGPCSVETEARTLEIARQVKAAGATIFRAGAFKARTNPYSFQGLGHEGLETLVRVRDETGLPVVSEVLDTECLPAMVETMDMLQIGARNMQNFSLLRAVGATGKPVLLKRGIAATLDEWLQAAEYLLAEGNKNVVLCERGVRTFNNHSRNTLDLNAVPLVQKLTHLPVIVDPSHGVGARDRVRSLSRAALASGADGLMLEVHTSPSDAYSDGQQTISVQEFAGVVRDREVLGQLEALDDLSRPLARVSA